MRKLLFLLATGFIIVGLYIYSQNSSNEPGRFKVVPRSVYSAWIPTWDQDKVLQSVASSSGKLSYLSPVWYRLDAKKKITEIKEGKKAEIKAIVKQSRINLIPTISNELDGKRATIFLKDEAGYKIQADNLVNIAETEGFQGWDIDFEEMSLSDQEAFSKFIKIFSEKLHSKKLLLTVSVHSQTGTAEDRNAAKAQDLLQIAKYADFIRVMIYDYHNTQTDPGPITPLAEYKQVLGYITKVVPPGQLVVGLPLYGYKWNKSNNSAVVYQDVQAIIQKLKLNLNRDKTSGEQIVSYSENSTPNVIWVEDSQSVIYKINIAREYGVYQFIFWRLGGEDLNLWEKL